MGVLVGCFLFLSANADFELGDKVHIIMQPGQTGEWNRNGFVSAISPEDCNIAVLFDVPLLKFVECTSPRGETLEKTVYFRKEDDTVQPKHMFCQNMCCTEE